MKKAAFISVLFLLLSISLLAYPVPVMRINGSKAAPLNPVALHIENTDLYVMDNVSNQLKVFSAETGKVSQNLIRLSKSASIVDIFVRDKQLYLLDDKRSGVLVFDSKGTFLRDFFTSGNPGLRFRNPTRIVVNYQGFIYVLDSMGIRAFTMEGVFFGSVVVEKPISMSLGEDQLIRVLRNSDKGLVVDYLDQYLNTVSASRVNTHASRPANIRDIAVNQWGEMHVINRDGTNIGKLGPNGAILPNTTFGAFDLGDQIGVFQNPVYIKCGVNGNSSLIGILDAKQKAIHLFRDTEAFTGQHLQRPAYTMRPSLVESSLPSCVDYLEAGGISYMISNATKTHGSKAQLSVWALDRDGKALFVTQLKDIPNKVAKGMDALALSHDKLYVLDTRAATVHILDSQSGAYRTSFAQKGKRENNLMVPVDIAIGENGLIYIADSGHGRISVFNEHNVFITNIPMPYPRSKPTMLRTVDGMIYFLTQEGNIYQIKNPRSDSASLYVDTRGVTAFELLHDGLLAIVDKNTQSMRIIGPRRLEHQLLAYDKNARFPFFADIHRLRYIAAERKLAILDRKTSQQRFLHFYAAPDRPDIINLVLNDEMQAELNWERMPGIEAWQVFQITDADTTIYNVNEPRFTIKEAHSSIYKYHVCSIAADGKRGELSYPVEDAFSYARYLSNNGNYAAAIYAFYRSNKSISDGRIDDEIVRNHILEAKLYQRSSEFEQALTSLESASRVKGFNKDIGLLAVEIFKQMGEYRRGINYLNTLGAQSNAEIMEQYIILHYFIKDYHSLIVNARAFQQKYGFNERVMRYEVEAYTATGQYGLALSTLTELAGPRPGFEDKLLIADLQIKLGNLSQANSHLQRMLTDHRNEKLDRVYALLGDCNFRLSQYGAASDFYNNAIMIDNKIASYYYGLAETYHFSRNRVEALRNYQIAHEHDVQNLDYAMAYARALERENRFPDALLVLDSIVDYITDAESSTSFHLLYSELLTREERYDDAYREILIVQSFAPDDPEVAQKVEAAYSAREIYNRAKPPVEIKEVEFDPIFPSLHEYYKNNPIGKVTLFNNRSLPITNIELKIYIPQIMDREASFRIPSLIANDDYEFQVIVDLNRRLFEYSRELSPRISITYALDDSLYNIPHSISRIKVLPDKAMCWSNRRQLASFVNPSDNILRTFVSSVLLQNYDPNLRSELNSNIIKALQVYSFYRANSIRYTEDPSTANREDTQIDYVQYPFQTLNSKGGDCEDLMVLLASSLEVIGVETGFIDVPGHVILAIDTKMNTDEILNSGLAVEFFIHRYNSYWLPLESTKLSTADFIGSWLDARKQYDDAIDSNVYPEIFRFNHIHNQYPAAQYTQEIDASLYRETTRARTYFNEDLSRILQMSLISQEQEFTETLRRYPNNLTVKNQYARWSYTKGKNQQAERLWLEILISDPTNFSAQVNLGNYYYNMARYDQARQLFIAALKHNKDTDEIKRNLCLLEYRAENKTKALEYFREIGNKDLVRDADIAIYSEFIRKGD